MRVRLTPETNTFTCLVSSFDLIKNSLCVQKCCSFLLFLHGDIFRSRGSEAAEASKNFLATAVIGFYTSRGVNKARRPHTCSRPCAFEEIN